MTCINTSNTTHIHMHTHTHTHTSTLTHKLLHTHAHTRICTHAHAHTHTHTCTRFSTNVISESTPHRRTVGTPPSLSQQWLVRAVNHTLLLILGVSRFFWTGFFRDMDTLMYIFRRKLAVRTFCLRRGINRVSGETKEEKKACTCPLGNSCGAHAHAHYLL